MHFEFLVEGHCELTTLSNIMAKIIGGYNDPHTWRIHKHQGVGKLPNNISDSPNPKDRSLLHNLPSKLRAYGRDFGENEVVVILVDLDDRDSCIEFKNELLNVLDFCNPKPIALIRIAIEELEAWFLGDEKALREAYPSYKKEKLSEYIQDSQCGTWELLAEAVHPGGINKLLKVGKRSRLVLEEKKKWAKGISIHMNIEENLSPSFCAFRDGLRKLT